MKAKLIYHYEIIVTPRFSPTYRTEFQIVHNKGRFYGVWNDNKTKDNLSSNLALGDIINKYLLELEDIQRLTINFINIEVTQ